MPIERPDATLSELLAQADVLSLYVSGGKSTHHLINADTLVSMKRGAILINASLGTVVEIPSKSSKN